MTDTERFELQLWDLAPERWLTPENRASHRVTDAKIVGDPGNEELVVEVERYREEEAPKNAGLEE
ncbi:hypothetical protein G9464_20765 [Halostella sp. JP-L12]|uniref:hypothetical protein n=1 Tax=Halostella TaxID=1843185 RepID=UPI000EF759B0|nr:MULTISPECIES: hypothetical protein [Halostella]NHN50004.1 hypothetical protein [Halostella sp. JP-L12]